jgi:hypothetical protein
VPMIWTSSVGRSAPFWMLLPLAHTSSDTMWVFPPTHVLTFSSVLLVDVSADGSSMGSPGRYID